MSTPQPNRKRAALFDLDGVLIDTEGIYTQLWGQIGRRYLPDMPEFALAIKGSTLTRILDTYFPNLDVRQKVVAELHTYEDSMTYDPFPGVIDFVNDLRANGVATAIVTSSGADKMNHLAQRQPDLLKAFDTIVSAADVTRSKPDPQGYLLAADRLGAKPEDCFVFEDSLSGLEAAAASGSRVIAVATTLPSSSLKGRGHIIVDSVADLTADQLLSLFP